MRDEAKIKLRESLRGSVIERGAANYEGRRVGTQRAQNRAEGRRKTAPIGNCDILWCADGSDVPFLFACRNKEQSSIPRLRQCIMLGPRIDPQDWAVKSQRDGYYKS